MSKARKHTSKLAEKLLSEITPEEMEAKRLEMTWDECICKKCGFRWFASEDEHFNVSFCYSCGSDKIGGNFYKNS